VKSGAIGSILVFLAISMPIALAADFTVEPREFTNDLRPSAIYQERLVINSLIPQFIQAKFECVADDSCEWAAFADGTGRSLTTDLQYGRNDQVTLFIEVIVPAEPTKSEYKFFVVVTNQLETVKVPFYLKTGYDPTPIEKGIVWLDDQCHSIHYEFPNSMVPPITCNSLVFILIALAVIIITVFAIRWARG
jgi:hypothetical protein